MSAWRSKSGNQIFGWLMLGAIVFGFGGYGVTNFGGSVSSIGTVGSQNVSTTDYNRALNQQLDAFRTQRGKQVTGQEALSLGLGQSVLQQLVTTAALDSEDDTLGLSVGDTALRAHIDGDPGLRRAGRQIQPHGLCRYAEAQRADRNRI